MPGTVQQFIQFFNSLTLGRKVSLALLLAILAAGGYYVSDWAQRPEYQVLYSKLDADDANQIIEKLREQKIPYQVGGSGDALLVPSERVHELRLHLASAGLPHKGGVGFEIFDRTGLGTTEFVQKVNYRRALQGELARTIAQISEVEQARVHIASPEKSLFDRGKQRARASVVLKLHPGRSLNSGQVQGVVHLVASSVEDLAPGSVTVVDNHGKILSRPPDESGTGMMTASQTEFQRSFERDLESRIQSMLEKAVGEGRAVTRVAAVMDFTRIERTEEKFDPDSAVPRSESRQQEKTSGASGQPAGVPGVAANLPRRATPAAAGGGSTSQSQRQNETINYEINKVVSHVVEPSGVVKKLSVAVLVDGNYEAAKNEKGEEVRKFVARPAEAIKTYENLVKKAIGFNPERGDQVEIAQVAFDTGSSPVEAEPAGTDWKSLAFRIGRIAAIPVFLALAFLFVIRPMMDAIRRAPAFPYPGGLPRTVGELEAEMRGGALPAPGVSREKAVELAKARPQETALLVKSWMKEK